ncbi:Fur family transcriptional regulator [Proteiniborus sp. MB09-C3]|uniref:Fur family transcriptional regulator n=1 Tax=Proteiniborus sp. MB09-C3 TaxID=3050072 RepID=UPI00255625E8|nr:Fur family transcriptional regulator [Proteiniborus sp. MB09-C3]WIV11313.1 Fur family transcriptional regulator [Proteiniborus sp. MB09-C3]
MDKTNALYENIQEKGYKLTNHRKTILDVLIENKDYLLEPSEIFEKVLKKNKDINFSTIYRNLEIFLNIGIVRKISLENGKGYYQIIFEDHHIHSMICKKCGRVETLKSCPFEKIDMTIFEKKGFLPDSHKFEIYGFCKECLLDKK